MAFVKSDWSVISEAVYALGLNEFMLILFLEKAFSLFEVSSTSLFVYVCNYLRER